MQDETVWRPRADAFHDSNAGRLARRLGVEGGYGALHAASIADLDRFWDAVVGDLGIPFSEPYTQVLDESRGPEWPRWFVGGRLNLASACVERFADDPASAGREAVVWEGEEGTTRSFTYAELARETSRLAEGLAGLGVAQGDAVALLLPMVPEAVAALYAVAALGALAVPIFSGFSAPAVASRLIDSGATVLITCDAFPRRGRPVMVKETADRAAADAPSLEHVVVVRRLGLEIPWREGRDVWYQDLVADRPGVRRATQVESEHPVLLGYTSGTTGRPKGAVHVHAGLLVKFASETSYIGGLGPQHRVHWSTDLGWIMGPWVVLGTHALGGTLVLLDGAPDFPDAGRLWQFVERHRLTFLGISPTLVRALHQADDEHHRAADLSSLVEFGSTGEPWNPEPYHWLAGEVGRGRVPIMNISGGTEVGAVFLGSPSYLSHKACSLGRPALGMAMDVYAPDGSSLLGRPGEVGELVCTRPWPAQTRGVYGDPERYLDAYWRRFPGVWTHGDWATVDADGEWFLHGRSDDTLNVAGKRIGPSEYESAAVADPDVVEACAVGIPHPVKGEVVWCMCVLRAGVEPSEDLRARVRARCADELGKAFAPAEVRFTSALPKTRSAKIVRRAVRATLLDEDPGDISTLEDPAALVAIRNAG
jgi:acetyl-CoA synthetase